MLKLFAGLTGIAAIMSQPMLLLGVLMMLCVLMSWGGAAIGADSGLTLLFSIGGLLIVWMAPAVAVVSSLVQDEKVIQRGKGGDQYARHMASNVRKNRVWNALGYLALGIFVPSLIVMVITGFVGSAACDRGDATGTLAFLYNPLLVLARSVGLSFPLSMC